MNAYHLVLHVRTLLRRYPRESIFIALWLLAMIAFPIAYWTVGPSVIPTAITTAAIAQVMAVYVAMAGRLGSEALRYLIGVAALTWLAEWIGSTTGFPFGVYHYTDVLQPQIFGVPLLIPFAWFMMMPAAWALTQIILGDPPTARPTLLYRLRFALVAAAAFTAWDLFLDPQMVGWNFWQFENTVGYFGIPWSNYGGWLLVSFTVSFLLCPPSLPKLPLLTIYACVWFLQSIGLAFFWGMPGPAFFGCVTMLGFMLLAYRRRNVTQWT